MNGISKRALGRLRKSGLPVTQAAIAGEWANGEGSTPVLDPATGEEVARVARCGAGWIDVAIESGQRAFESWRETLPSERGRILRRWAELVRGSIEDLSVIMVAEQGKPLLEAKAEITYAANFLDWFAAEGERAYGETIPSHRVASRSFVAMQPIGICAAITPWNFPSAMITRKAGAALAAGCVVIVKPAPETPLSALALARLGQEAGLPPGVFQVVTGDAVPLAQRLVSRPEVRALSFTGSTEVGRLLLKGAADTVKKVSMELGGHAPFMVFPDANLEDAVMGCVSAKFPTSGQDCLAANRIYVHRSIFEPFAIRLAAATARLRVGHGLEPGTDIGPMTRNSVARKCAQHIGDALSKGARLLAGGQECSLGRNFVEPTVLADVTEEMLVSREETFGPVAALLVFDEEAEVLRRANASEMGLAAYVYTRDLNRAMRLSDRLECGMVGVNTPSFTGAPVPFGGWKQSGLGREGSRHGIAEYMQLKYVCFGNLAT